MLIQLTLPSSLEETGNEHVQDFLGMIAVRNAVANERIPDGSDTYSAAEMFASWSQPGDTSVGFVVKIDGEYVARAAYWTARVESPSNAWTSIEVLPAVRRQGIGSALLQAVLDYAAQQGVETVGTHTTSPPLEHSSTTGSQHRGDVPPELFVASNGQGRIAATAPAQFFHHRGFALEQVVVRSSLALPNTIDATTVEQHSSHATDYDIETWEAPSPESVRAELAVLKQRMSSDAPNGGIAIDEDPWDEARIADAEQGILRGGRRLLISAARHRASNHLVAFSELVIPEELDRTVAQEDTLVLQEHRGHRLGFLVKAANLAALEQRAPGHPAVTTYNAAENAPMLAVNAKLGFKPVDDEGVWQYRFPSPTTRQHEGDTE
ncbi:GNAT family N-acetyltransferase [Humidisolicoccus flavus]|uniref:GNAT family N-acetyltransferase n=1 Tax=Humidisolicoccus flavus TaxID=3111414 RepID=UPI00325509A0